MSSTNIIENLIKSHTEQEFWQRMEEKSKLSFNREKKKSLADPHTVQPFFLAKTEWGEMWETAVGFHTELELNNNK